ncbi:MAG: FAD-binding oxidoreductase [Fimbriimonas sp.]
MQLSESEMIAGLESLIAPERVLTGPAAQRGYDCDAYTVDRSKPMCVVLPESTEEVARIVQWCNRNHIPFTARGAGTGLSGGAMPAQGGVVISTKRMNRVLEIDLDNKCLHAQAGIANKRITDAVKEHGLHFAPDPSSQTVCTLGGNIAENAGGPHTLKYGVTVQHVLGLTLVEPGGQILHFGGKVAGGPGFDFLGLIVGGEGTMGIVTEAWVRLTPLPVAVITALVAFPTIRDATQTVADIIAEGTIPAALEMMDRGVLNAITMAYAISYPPETAALLLIECDASSEVEGPGERVRKEMEVVQATCLKNNAIEIRIAEDEAERQKLWIARKKGIGAMGRLAPTVVTHDGVIPRSKLPEMLDHVYRIAQEQKIGVANIFHAGDGNLHPIFYFDDRDPDQVERVVLAGEELMTICVQLGGSISGEHGIGVEKAELMSIMFTPDDLALQLKVKSIFNQNDLCNPCKIIPNQKSCVEHRMRWRGVAT